MNEEISQTLGTSDKKKFKAVILAAGKDEDLFPLTEDIPKTLLDVKGKIILERQIDMLRSVGINDIAVVRGYKKDKINFPNLKYFDNDEYDNTGSLASLFSSREFMDTDTIVLYSDILFEIETLKRLIESKGNTTLVVDRGWKKHYQDSLEGHSLPPELTTLSEETANINAVGVGLPETDLTSEFIGLARLSANACLILSDVYKNIYCKDKKQDFHSAECIQNASFVDFIQELINRDEEVTALEIWRSWIDIDTFEDYRNSWKLIENIGQR
ncbi:MAG: phosphocholine cytidylyltransferase family protein [Planctomycetes bacterium]|nr:phosphocholine cytidylyltransferase family protein [Planctomycetota bacterium]